jgi:FkbM family methyltransferase
MDCDDELLLARLSQLEARLESLGNTLAAQDQRRCIYLGHDRLLIESRTGLRLYLDTRDIVLTPLLALKGDWEPEVTHALRRVIRPGMTFIDVGANVGYFTLIAAQILHGNGQIHSFEADPQMHQLLVDNINLNWFFEGVHAHQKAVYSEETNLRFHKRLKYQANSSIAELTADELASINDVSESFEVEALRLDHYIEQAAAGRVDVIKIDVEGAEPRVFQGMAQTIENNPDLRIICEWSPSQLYQTGSSPTEFLAILRDYGFLIRTVEAPETILEPERLLDMSHNNLLLSR